MTDTTAQACERLFELMDNQPSTPIPHRNYTADAYDNMLRSVAARARDPQYVAPSPMGWMWDPAMMGDYWD